MPSPVFLIVTLPMIVTPDLNSLSAGGWARDSARRERAGRAAGGRAELIALPENFAYLRPEGSDIRYRQSLDGELAGGLYGVALGAAFFGESMFALHTDASKVAFVVLVEQLLDWHFELVDCQIRTQHLARFGARDWSRARFQEALRKALQRETRMGPWRLAPRIDAEARGSDA